MKTTSPTPDAILQTAFGFWNSKVLLTAVTFDLFTALGQSRLTGAEIGKKLGLHPRGVADFLDALVAMKFLERDGDGADAKYFNTSATALYLDRNSPRYIGGIPEMLNARLFKYWNDLPEALRTGKPQNETKHGGKNIFDELYADPEKLECFLDGMTGLSRINFEALADKFDFSRYRSLCDVGGATGLLCIEVAKKHPHIQCISFDLPPVEPVAKKHIAAAGLADRISTATGDFFQDPAAEGGRGHDGNDSARLEPGEKDAAHPRGLRRASTRRRVHCSRSADRQRAPRKCLWPAHVAKHADRIRRRVRLFRRRFRKMVPRSRIQALRSHPSCRPIQRRDRLQVGRAGPECRDTPVERRPRRGRLS